MSIIGRLLVIFSFPPPSHLSSIGSITVSIRAFQARGPGSIPGRCKDTFFAFRFRAFTDSNY